MDKQVVKTLDLAVPADDVRKAALELLDVLLLYRGREHDGVARLEICLEGAWHKEILLALEAPSELVGIGDVVVPVRHVSERCLAAQLQIEIREALIHAERHSSVNLTACRVRLLILFRQAVHASEGKKRLQDESRLHRRLDEIIPYEHLIIVRNHENRLGEDDLTYLIGDLRLWISVKVNDVLVASRLVDVTIAVDAEVELPSVHEQTLVER